MQTVSYTHAHSQLRDLIQQVINDRQPVRIHCRGTQNTVLISEIDYQNLIDTLYLLSNPNRAEGLLQAATRSPEQAIEWEAIKDDLGVLSDY